MRFLSEWSLIMKRRAFTLVEMLVVVAIIIVLLGITLWFWPKRENVAARDTAGKIESFIAGAKARALRENRPVSVRLLTSDNGNTFTGMQLVDNGADFMPPIAANTFLDLPSGDAIQLANQNNNPNPVGNTARQFGFNLQGTVEVGDMLEIHDVTPSSHKIIAIDYATNTMTLAATKTLHDLNGNGIWEPAVPSWLGDNWFVGGVPNVSSVAAVRLQSNYRYIRSPRPLMGEQPLDFNRDVVIRGVGAVGTIPSSLNIPRGRNGDWEITFSPSGQVIGANGRIVLWIEDTNRVAKPVLLCIYPTSGMKSHDVGPVGNEFQFTTDGR